MDETTPTCCRSDLSLAGGRYQRELEADSDLEALLAMSPQAALASAPTRRPEAVVALLRIWAAQNDTEHAWRLAEILVVVTEAYVRKSLAGFPWIGSDAREDISHDLALRLYEEWFASDGRYAFWEVRFWHCLRLRIIDVLRKGRFASPDVMPSDETIEGLAQDPRRRSQSDEIERIAALALLDRLDDRVRRVFILKHYAQWTEEEIAEEMKVSSRTIRNWLHRARRSLDAMLRR